MNTAFILMAQYNGLAIIPLELVCRDYITHLTPEKLKAKIARGEIDLPLIQLEKSQKAARGVHITDLANYLDTLREQAIREHYKLMGKALKRAA